MLVKAQSNVVVKEFLNWTLLIVVVAILSLMLSRAASGGRPVPGDVPPGTLPPMGELATPMAPMPDVPREIAPPAGNEFGLIADAWTVLELHRSRNMEEAIEGWQRLTLPRDTAVWQSVGLAAANLRVGNVEKAADVLSDGLLLDPDNAVLHYYQGLVLLTMSVEAADWYDDATMPHTCLVSHSPERASVLYRLGAIHEFERVVELAKDVNLEQPLVPPVVFAGVPMIEPIGTGVANPMWVSQPGGDYIEPLYRTPMPLEPPTVSDLLAAVGADDFEGKAHNLLAPLYLGRGLLQQAEEHMDAAVALDMNVLDGYGKLADRYEARGQYGDAFRANLKAIGGADGIVGPAQKAFDAFRKSLDKSW